MGHTSTFAMDAALVASQWQRRAWTVSLHPWHAGQVASIVLHVFVMTRPGIDPSLPALLEHAQSTVPLSSSNYSLLLSYLKFNVGKSDVWRPGEEQISLTWILKRWALFSNCPSASTVFTAFVLCISCLKHRNLC